MTTHLRHLAPAGAPIRIPDLARWAALAVPSGDVADGLREAIRARFGVRHAFLTSTGRAGLTMLFTALRRLSPEGRDEVVLPSYTCFSVAASAVKAGLRPRIVDIRPETLDYDPDALQEQDFSRVVAIVATNLYGLPNALPSICATARRHGVFVIDDAAQAMGASVGGRRCGTWGDAGLFSLDKGKNVSAIDGGIVITNNPDVAAAFDEELRSAASPGLAESAVGVAKALAYFALLRPWLYWIPNSIPQLELGATVFTTDFPLARPSRPLAALGLTMLAHLDEFTAARRANAAALLERLNRVPGIRTVAPLDGAAPVYLRLPILAKDPQDRRRVLDGLVNAGIGATASYPASLADIPELHAVIDRRAGALRGGRHVAAHIITLPTHTFVGAADVDRITATVAAARS